MGEKLPYYMVYPTPFDFDDERLERRDYEYMRSMYPDTAKRVLPYVEEECDRMEYRCSMMYDEYPDRLQLRMMCNRIYGKVRKNEKNLFEDKNHVDTVEGNQNEELAEQQMLGEGYRRHGMPDDTDRLRDLIEVLLFQEMQRRRRQQRREKRRFY